MFRTFFKTVLPIGVAAACAFAGMALLKIVRRPDAPPPARRLPLVRVLTVLPTSHRFDVKTYGVVHPETETTLVARVQGTVVSVSPSFTEGGFFAKGEVLVAIDRRDFELRRVEAAATVAEATAVYDRIRAESDVARKEWKSFGKGEPQPLAVREPQLAEAKAKLDAAQARLDGADLDLERTQIRAPYDGRVKTKLVDIGQYVATGTPIGVVFGTKSAEVRLPVSSEQLQFLDLPYTIAGKEEQGAKPPAVTIEGMFAGNPAKWPGTIVRTEGEVDPRTRVLFAVARVVDPYGREGDRTAPLLPGMFVMASIEGRTLPQVTEIPEEALRGEDRVLLVTPGNRLKWQKVTVLRSTDQGQVAVAGLTSTERVCLTDVHPVVEGMPVRVATGDEKER